MKISVLLPTRGRPALLKQSVEALWATLANSDDTTVVIGFDEDESDMGEFIDTLDWDNKNCEVLNFLYKRPDIMGEKYNNLARECPADLYVAWADDVQMTTHGWDDRLRQYARYFGPEPGFVFCGQANAVALPTLYSMNHAMFTALGYFAPEWFPNWWCETWITEIALLTRRVVWAEPKIEYTELQASSPTGRGRTQGLRDLAFWTEFFEATRASRIEDARAIMLSHDPAWRRVHAFGEWPYFYQAFEQVFSGELRRQAEAFERMFCIDQESTDPRYTRAKEKAIQWLRQNPELTKAFQFLVPLETANIPGTK